MRWMAFVSVCKNTTTSVRDAALSPASSVLWRCTSVVTSELQMNHFLSRMSLSKSAFWNRRRSNAGILLYPSYMWSKPTQNSCLNVSLQYILEGTQDSKTPNFASFKTLPKVLFLKSQLCWIGWPLYLLLGLQLRSLRTWQVLRGSKLTAEVFPKFNWFRSTGLLKSKNLFLLVRTLSQLRNCKADPAVKLWTHRASDLDTAQPPGWDSADPPVTA